MSEHARTPKTPRSEAKPSHDGFRASCGPVADQLEDLQRSVGNRAVGMLVQRANGPAGARPSRPLVQRQPGPDIVEFDVETVEALIEFWRRELVGAKSPAEAARVQSNIDTLRSGGRPTWRQSEREIQFIHSWVGGKRGRPYIEGRATGAATRGSTVPDAIQSATAVEVKNYRITARGRKALKRELVRQVGVRRAHLPYDMRQQTVILDMRGQNVLSTELTALAHELADATGLPVQNFQVVRSPTLPSSTPAVEAAAVAGESTAAGGAHAAHAAGTAARGTPARTAAAGARAGGGAGKAGALVRTGRVAAVAGALALEAALLAVDIVFSSLESKLNEETSKAVRDGFKAAVLPQLEAECAARLEEYGRTFGGQRLSYPPRPVYVTVHWSLVTQVQNQTVADWAAAMFRVLGLRGGFAEVYERLEVDDLHLNAIDAQGQQGPDHTVTEQGSTYRSTPYVTSVLVADPQVYRLLDAEERAHGETEAQWLPLVARLDDRSTVVDRGAWATEQEQVLGVSMALAQHDFDGALVGLATIQESLPRSRGADEGGRLAARLGAMIEELRASTAQFAEHRALDANQARLYEALDPPISHRSPGYLVVGSGID